MLDYEILFLISLLITILIETIALILITKLWFKDKTKISLLIFTGIFCSLTTLPYLWFILPMLIKDKMTYIIIGEFVVFLVEALILKVILKMSWKKATIISLICNLASFLIGLILF